jgi:hypothetical protein
VLEDVGIAEPNFGPPLWSMMPSSISRECATRSRMSGAYDAEVARIDLGNHTFGEYLALRQC